jgi:hypothetical protein
MEARKTVKHHSSATTAATITEAQDPFRTLLDESARDAFRCAWHKLGRGLRLNRLRIYVKEKCAQSGGFTEAEEGGFFNFLQGALDRKVLNSSTIVKYSPDEQRILTIEGLEVGRRPDGSAKWGFLRVKKEGTRRAKPVPKNETVTAAPVEPQA